MTSPENQPRRGYGGEDPRRASDAPIKDDAAMGRRYIEVSDESGAGDSIALRGYGGEDGSRASDEPIRDDVEGVATRAVAGPLRVAEGDYAEGIDDYADGVGRRYVEDSDAQRGYGGEEARRASDEPIRDDVEGAARRAMAGPRRVEEDSMPNDSPETGEVNEAAVEQLADAMESGEVSHDEAAEKIAELMEQNDSLKHQVESLENQVKDLLDRVDALLKKLEEKAGAATPDDQEASEGASTEDQGDTEAGKEDSSETDTFTTDDQEALRKKLAEEDAAREPSKELVVRPKAELERIDRSGPLSAIREELAGSENAAKYSAALSRYAELKAKSETRGRLGRKGREQELLDAESDLIEAKIAYENDALKLAGERGLYPGNEEMAKQQKADDMFNALRGLDVETRRAVNGIHDYNKEHRNIFVRRTADVGRWLTSGGKVAQWAKGGGSGLVAGLGIGLTGVGIPITTIAGIGLGLGVRGAATVANLDRIRATENKDAQGNAKAVMNDEEFRIFLRESAENGTSPADRAQALAQRILEKSRNVGYEQANRARKEAAGTMGKFGLGFTAGMFTGNFVHDAFMNAHATNVGVKHIDTHTGDKVHHIKFPHGADKISSGEGWYSQFNDMGMSHKEARAMFRDSGLMNKLVNMGAAYVDHSARIGGYGINMPKGGHLSGKVMELIGEAMKAKGF